MTMLLRMDDIRAGAFDPYSAASLNSNRFVIQSRPTQTSAGENAMACTVYTASANTSHGMEVRAAFQRLCRQLPRKRSCCPLTHAAEYRLPTMGRRRRRQQNSRPKIAPSHRSHLVGDLAEAKY